MNIQGKVSVFSVTETDKSFMLNGSFGVGDNSFQKLCGVVSKSRAKPSVLTDCASLVELIELRKIERDEEGDKHIRPVQCFIDGSVGEITVDEYSGKLTPVPRVFIYDLQGTSYK